MRTLRNLAFFVLGVVFVALPLMASAETITATGPTTVPAVAKWGYTKSDNGLFPASTVTYATADAAGQAAYAASSTTWNGYTLAGGPFFDSACTLGGYVSPGALYFKWRDAVGNVTCRYAYASVFIQSYVCSSGTLSGTSCTGAYSCPSGQNWTLSGSSCTRPDCPYGRNADGTCKANACSGLGGTSDGFWTGQQYCAKGSLVSAPSVVCQNGCVMTLGGVGVGTSTYWCQQVGKYTGEPCATNSPAGSGTSDGVVDDGGEKLPTDSPEKKCVDQGKAFGSVNGVIVCVDPTTSTGSKATTTTNKDGSGNTTSSSSSSSKTQTTKNPDGSTTTTTTVTNPDATTTTTTQTTDGSENGGGGNGLDGSDLGNVPGEGGITEKSIGVSSITPVVLATNESCPAPVALAKGQVFSFDKACNLAGMIKPAVLAFAWFGALLIAVGFKTE